MRCSADVVDNNEMTLDEAVRPRIRAGAAISSREYLEVLAEREQLKLEFAAAMAESTRCWRRSP